MNRVRYIYMISMGNIEIDSFLFFLLDGINRWYVEIFEIRIRNFKKSNLVVYNKGLYVWEGERMLLLINNLSVFDESMKVDEIVFVII